MADLQKLKAEILADGRIDEEEVTRIRAELYADGKIDKEEVEFLIALRNEARAGHHWLGVELIGRPYRDAVGARLELEVGGQKLVRAVKGGGSYLSSGDRRILVGLGDTDRVDRVTVNWPWGEQQRWEGLASGRYWKLVEGEKEAR